MWQQGREKGLTSFSQGFINRYTICLSIFLINLPYFHQIKIYQSYQSVLRNLFLYMAQSQLSIYLIKVMSETFLHALLSQDVVIGYRNPKYRTILQQLQLKLLWDTKQFMFAHSISTIAHKSVVLPQHFNLPVKNEPNILFGEVKLLPFFVLFLSADESQGFNHSPLEFLEKIIAIYEGLNEVLHIVVLISQFNFPFDGVILYLGLLCFLYPASLKKAMGIFTLRASTLFVQSVIKLQSGEGWVLVWTQVTNIPVFFGDEKATMGSCFGSLLGLLLGLVVFTNVLGEVYELLLYLHSTHSYTLIQLLFISQNISSDSRTCDSANKATTHS